MKLLAFLGTAEYKETTYIWTDQQHTSRYCPAAVAHFFQPETTLVVVTEDAEAKHFEALADEISAITRPVPIPIPDGHRQADLWTIFDALTGHVAVEDTLVVDITNGFRSLPFLSFLAIAYLRVAKQANVQGIYYGAWEARDEQNRSPVFDLTPFVTLLDWTVATDRFARFGDAHDLADLLRADMPPGLQMRDDLEARQLGQGLKAAATAMEAISLALRVARPLESMEASHQLVETLQRHRDTIQHRARPFAVLADAIEHAYHSFGLQAPLSRSNWHRNLVIQREMIGWYLDKGQVVQAVTLAREWLLSCLIFRLGGNSLVDYERERGPAEAALNNAVEASKPGGIPRRASRYDAAFQEVPQREELVRLWSTLRDLRNDLAHVGMKPRPGSAANVCRKAHSLYPCLKSISEKLLESAS